MKIIHITTHLDYGGIPNYIVTLSRAMAQQGHEVLVISSGGPMVKQLEGSGIRHLEFDLRTKSEISPKVLFFMPKFLGIIKKEKPDLIHAHTRIAQVLSQMARRKAGVPYVATCHGFFKARGARLLFPCWGDRVIAISEAVKKHLMEDFNLDEKKVKLVYNGIDLRKFSGPCAVAEKNESRAKLGLNGAKVVGIVSRLSTVKGHKYLFESLAALGEKYPELKLLVVGDGPLKKQLSEYAKKLGIEQKVVFKSSTADVARYLCVMDIFAMPTLQEGLGLSIIEAMAMGVPVIASDVPGVRTLVKDAETGLLFAPASSGAISIAIERLLSDNKFSKQLAENARKLVHDKFTIESMASEVEKLYKDTAGAKKT